MVIPLFLENFFSASIFPNSPLSDRVRNLIIQTFEVSNSEASEYANELAALAEGWGDNKTAEKLDWTYRIKKDLGKRLKWRSATERENFELGEKQKVAAYEKYITNQKRHI